MRVFSVEDTQHLAAHFATLVQNGDCITLQGDLGAGKTTFVQQLITSLSPGRQVGVTSPTFTLLQTYDVTLTDGSDVVLWHYDLYRLEDESEADELALEDALMEGVTVIEWPELILHWLPQDRISVVIDFSEAPNGRDIRFSVSGARLRQFQEADLC